MAINWNARSELSYEWVAKYKDGTELRQYDEVNDVEYHFGFIDQGKLVEFVLVSRSDPSKTFSVNVETGVFSINGKEVQEITVNDQPVSLGLRFKEGDVVESKVGLNKVALIYYRKVQRAVIINSAKPNQRIVAELGPANTKFLGIWNFMGWEGKVNGVYQKFEIAIDANGNILIPPKSNFTPL